MVYTLPRAIKEEKKNEERVGSLESKREQGWQIEKVKKRNEREVQRGWISCFFISVRKSAEREYFKKKEREELFLGIQRPRVSGRSFFGFPCSFRIVAVSILRCFVHLNGHFINKKSFVLFMTSLSFIWMHDA